ncbi:hypothetical protein LSAT2_008142 [Lamellibrachia satsuma]|nr:hypothetical protein LSAT2_008142 [Lamellibrachia satsuma]
MISASDPFHVVQLLDGVPTDRLDRLQAPSPLTDRNRRSESASPASAEDRRRQKCPRARRPARKRRRQLQVTTRAWLASRVWAYTSILQPTAYVVHDTQCASDDTCMIGESGVDVHVDSTTNSLRCARHPMCK